MILKNRSNFQGHPFHLVSPSPWPLLTSVSLLTLTTTGVWTLHGFPYAFNWLAVAFFVWIGSMFLWFRDIISEGRTKSLSLYLFNLNNTLKTAKAIRRML